MDRTANEYKRLCALEEKLERYDQCIKNIECFQRKARYALDEIKSQVANARAQLCDVPVEGELGV